MLSPGVALALCAAVFKAGKSVTTKLAAEAAGALVAALGIRACAVPWLLAVVVVVGVPSLRASPTFWVLLLVYVAALSIVTVLTTAAYAQTDVSVVAPILALLPVAVAVPSFLLLAETPSPFAGVGLVLVSIGTYTLNLGSVSDGPFAPLAALATDRGARYAAATLVVAAALPSLTKIGLRTVSPPVWTLLTHVLMSAVLLVVVSARVSDWQATARRNVAVLVVLGALNAGVWIAQTYAYTQTQVAYVQAIKRASIVLVVAAGRVVFDEERTAERLVGGAVIVVGVTAVVVGA